MEIPVLDSENLAPPLKIDSNKRKRLWFIIGGIITLLVVIVLVVIYILKTNNNGDMASTYSRREELAHSFGQSIKNITPNLSSPTPTSSPNFAFPELTIPYLRAKEYKSSLGEMQEYSNNGSYTSYLTSYNSDGFKINGLLTVPNEEKPAGGFPAIVFIHGYIPPKQYQTTTQYASYVDTLARNGFVVFKIDLRGHGSSEGEAGGGYFGSDYVIDALNARAALQSSDFVNKDAIGMWGHSMAGNIVMRSLAAKPEIKAGVIWSGAVYTYLDMQKYGISDSSYQPSQASQQGRNRRRELFEKEGNPSATSSFWHQVAPTNFLNDLKGAVQLNHAIDDNVVDIGYSRDLNQLLDQTKVPHEFHTYNSGGHNISGASFTEAIQNTIDFFKKYL